MNLTFEISFISAKESSRRLILERKSTIEDSYLRWTDFIFVKEFSVFIL